MKPTDSPPPKASAGHGPESAGAAGRSQPPSGRYDDGVVHHPHYDAAGHDDFHNEDVAHEHADVNLRGLVTSGVVLLSVLIGSVVAMYLLLGWFGRSAAASDPVVSPLASPSTQMPKTTASPAFSQGAAGPQLLTNEPLALQQTRSEDQRRLHEYAWVNASAGVARIPIDEAKKLIVQRGVPVRQGEAVAPELGTGLPARGEASGGRVITVPLPEPSGGTPAVPTGQDAQPQPHGDQPPGQPAPVKPPGGGH